MLKNDFVGKEYNLFHEEFRWKSDDGLLMYSQCWEPDCAPRAVIAFIHGLGEHSSRYINWAEKFVNKGFSFCSFDLRGHGKSPGKRGHAVDYSRLLKDVGCFIEKCTERYENTPVILYGHSFGANLAVNFSISNLTNVHGIILTSPWFELKQKPSLIKLSLSRLLRTILPSLTVKTGLKPEHISRDLRIVHRYKSDELIHDKISVKLGRQAMEFGEKAARSIYKINAPLLVMHGTADSITCCKASKQFVQNAGKKTKYIEWEGAYHELHNDIDQDEVFDAIASWINENLS